jgi:hypothetical protein
MTLHYHNIYVICKVHNFKFDHVFYTSLMKWLKRNLHDANKKYLTQLYFEQKTTILYIYYESK